MSDQNQSAKSWASIIEHRLSRRSLVKGLLGGAASALVVRTGEARSDEPRFGFAEIAPSFDDKHRLAHGHRADVLVSWGDPILPGAPKLDLRKQSPHRQSQQFGYNNDFTAYVPLESGSRASAHGLLCVNHEYTDAEQMFPGLVRKTALHHITREQAEIEIAAHGHTVLEIIREEGRWRVVGDSRFNRRITGTTPTRMSGPAAGHPRLRTSADPSGMKVLGTLGNCSGGVTPWGTVLTAEENVDLYFLGDHPSEARNHARFGVSAPPRMGWARYFKRFQVDQEPHEANRFGWIVEVDPRDPTRTPLKRTALGRFKHECASVTLNHDGRVVVYSGDDQKFEHLYRFVSNRRYDPKNPEANRDLLDDGVLYAARFSDSGVEWMPLVYGQGPLTSKNGFHSQADVLIEARLAADLMGATHMDRPEDVEVAPVGGRVYVALTNNTERQDLAPANPRCPNTYGHVLELVVDRKGGGFDYAAREHGWDVFLLGNDLRESAPGQLSCPDNFAFDRRGRLWICTDGQDRCGMADSIYATEIAGPNRAKPRRFFNAPVGAEVTGPSFTPDGTTLFLSVQHPGQGEDGSLDAPKTRWPEFGKSPPKPSIIAITRENGDEVG